MADLILPRGEIKVLQAEDKDYKRGLLVRLLKDGGYDMAYWFNKPDKPYPVEVLVDGESIKKDAKVVEMKFHPKDYYDKQKNEITEFAKHLDEPREIGKKKKRLSSSEMRKLKDKAFETYNVNEMVNITPSHIELLRTTFDTVKGINPSGSAYKNLVAFLDNLSKSSLKKLANARIKFVSPLAKNRLNEDWSDKYKKSINCNNPKGFSQKAHCAGRKKQESMMNIKSLVKETIKEVVVERQLNMFLEKNTPTNPSKWSYYKSQAKKKFDVYPSAYANAWAAKQYKAAGGGWKKG